MVQPQEITQSFLTRKSSGQFEVDHLDEREIEVVTDKRKYNIVLSFGDHNYSRSQKTDYHRSTVEQLLSLDATEFSDPDTLEFDEVMAREEPKVSVSDGPETSLFEEVQQQIKQQQARQNKLISSLLIKSLQENDTLLRNQYDQFVQQFEQHRRLDDLFRKLPQPVTPETKNILDSLFAASKNKLTDLLFDTLTFNDNHRESLHQTMQLLQPTTQPESSLNDDSVDLASSAAAAGTGTNMAQVQENDAAQANDRLDSATDDSLSLSGYTSMFGLRNQTRTNAAQVLTASTSVAEPDARAQTNTNVLTNTQTEQPLLSPNVAVGEPTVSTAVSLVAKPSSEPVAVPVTEPVADQGTEPVGEAELQPPVQELSSSAGTSNNQPTTGLPNIVVSYAYKGQSIEQLELVDNLSLEQLKLLLAIFEKEKQLATKQANSKPKDKNLAARVYEEWKVKVDYVAHRIKLLDQRLGYSSKAERDADVAKFTHKWVQAEYQTKLHQYKYNKADYPWLTKDLLDADKKVLVAAEERKNKTKHERNRSRTLEVSPSGSTSQSLTKTPTSHALVQDSTPLQVDKNESFAELFEGGESGKFAPSKHSATELAIFALEIDKFCRELTINSTVSQSTMHKVIELSKESKDRYREFEITNSFGDEREKARLTRIHRKFQHDEIKQLKKTGRNNLTARERLVAKIREAQAEFDKNLGLVASVSHINEPVPASVKQASPKPSFESARDEATSVVDKSLHDQSDSLWLPENNDSSVKAKLQLAKDALTDNAITCQSLQQHYLQVKILSELLEKIGTATALEQKQKLLDLAHQLIEHARMVKFDPSRWAKDFKRNNKNLINLTYQQAQDSEYGKELSMLEDWLQEQRFEDAEKVEVAFTAEVKPQEAAPVVTETKLEGSESKLGEVKLGEGKLAQESGDAPKPPQSSALDVAVNPTEETTVEVTDETTVDVNGETTADIKVNAKANAEVPNTEKFDEESAESSTNSPQENTADSTEANTEESTEESTSTVNSEGASVCLDVEEAESSVEVCSPEPIETAGFSLDFATTDISAEITETGTQADESSSALSAEVNQVPSESAPLESLDNRTLDLEEGLSLGAVDAMSEEESEVTTPESTADGAPEATVEVGAEESPVEITSADSVESDDVTEATSDLSPTENSVEPAEVLEDGMNAYNRELDEVKGQISELNKALNKAKTAHKEAFKQQLKPLEERRDELQRLISDFKKQQRLATKSLKSQKNKKSPSKVSVKKEVSPEQQFIHKTLVRWKSIRDSIKIQNLKDHAYRFLLPKEELVRMDAERKQIFQEVKEEYKKLRDPDFKEHLQKAFAGRINPFSGGSAIFDIEKDIEDTYKELEWRVYDSSYGGWANDFATGGELYFTKVRYLAQTSLAFQRAVAKKKYLPLNHFIIILEVACGLTLAPKDQSFDTVIELQKAYDSLMRDHKKLFVELCEDYERMAQEDNEVFDYSCVVPFWKFEMPATEWIGLFLNHNPKVLEYGFRGMKLYDLKFSDENGFKAPVFMRLNDAGELEPTELLRDAMTGSVANSEVKDTVYCPDELEEDRQFCPIRWAFSSVVSLAVEKVLKENGIVHISDRERKSEHERVEFFVPLAERFGLIVTMLLQSKRNAGRPEIHVLTSYPVDRSRYKLTGRKQSIHDLLDNNY